MSNREYFFRNLVNPNQIWAVIITEGKSGTVFFYDDNKIKMARKPGKKQKENQVECTGEGKLWKGNIRDG